MGNLTRQLNRHEIAGLKYNLLQKITEIFDSFGIDHSIINNKITCECPIHEGDNITAFNLDIDEDSNHYGKWFCNTHLCHEEWGNDILGFMTGLLSKEKELAFNQVLEYCLTICEATPKNIIKNDDMMRFFGKKYSEVYGTATRDQVRKRLIIPCRKYSDLSGISLKTLDNFDIGLCRTTGSSMYNRVVFPVYNDGHFVGCTGRLPYEEIFGIKWKNSKGFDKAKFLYNYDIALQQDSKNLIITEGQGDVLKLYEAGFKNVVGLFGCYMTEEHRVLIEKTPAMQLILMLDNDKAGEKGSSKIKSQLGRLYNIVEPEFEGKDVGALNLITIKDILNDI